MNFNIEKKTLKIYLYWYSKYKMWDDKYEFVRMCKEKYSVPTQRIIISAIKHFENNEFSKGILFPRGQSAWREVLITSIEYNKIINELVYEDKYVSCRNKTMIKVLWYTGMRISELLDLRWSDISNGFIKVMGKGRKKRVIPIKEGIIDFENNFEYIFASKWGGRLSYSSVVRVFKDVKSILNRNDVSPHAFRHSFATRLLKKDVPIHYISKLLGHSSLSITERYLQWNMEEIKKELNTKDWLS